MRTHTVGTPKVMVVTTSRADYGILFPLLTAFKEDGQFKVNLVVTGAHLFSIYGETVKEIQKDGLLIGDTVRMALKGDQPPHLCGAVSRGLIGFSKLFQKELPELVIVAGDRYELLAVCIAAVMHKIPIAHIHGGELTRGAIDDRIRHTITKMASLHFPSTEVYGRRIVQMGEDPHGVHVVGALGIDTIKQMRFMDEEELSTVSGVDFKKKVALVTYHPVTLDDYSLAAKQVREVLQAVVETELFGLITMPNADTGSLQIYKAICSFVQTYPQKFKLIKNLGQRAYLSAMRCATVMIGNSSSGIVESASFKLPVVNVGDRQEGRLKPANVIDCDCSKEAVLQATHRALSQEFIRSLSHLKNPYGEGDSARRIIQVLKTIDLENNSQLVKKRFHDLELFEPVQTAL